MNKNYERIVNNILIDDGKSHFQKVRELTSLVNEMNPKKETRHYDDRMRVPAGMFWVVDIGGKSFIYLNIKDTNGFCKIEGRDMWAMIPFTMRSTCIEKNSANSLVFSPVDIKDMKDGEFYIGFNRKINNESFWREILSKSSYYYLKIGEAFYRYTHEGEIKKHKIEKDGYFYYQVKKLK